MRLRSRHQYERRVRREASARRPQTVAFTDVLVPRTESLNATSTWSGVRRERLGRRTRRTPSTATANGGNWNRTVNDPNCRAHNERGHVCFDQGGNVRAGGTCFFEAVCRLADKAREIDQQVSEFATIVAGYAPPEPQ